MAGPPKLRTFHSTAAWKREHLSTLLRELANSGICLPEIGFGSWNYSGGVEPLLAAIEYGVCRIDTAEEYGTEEIAGQAIEGQRDGVFPAACRLRISRGATQLRQQNEAFATWHRPYRSLSSTPLAQSHNSN
jgi:hypothetical protein